MIAAPAAAGADTEISGPPRAYARGGLFAAEPDGMEGGPFAAEPDGTAGGPFAVSEG